MTVRDEIAAIYADGAGDKAGRCSRLKSQRARESLPALPYAWTQGRYEVAITRGRIVDGNIELLLGVKRDGVPVSVSNPFVFVNPPILVPDPAGDVDLGPDRGMHREDIIVALRTIVLDALKLVVK